MSIFGAALRGFGKALKSSKRKARRKRLGLPAETNKQMRTRLKTFKAASEKQKLKSDVKKLDKDFKKASERAEKFSKSLMKQNYSKSAVNKYLTKEYKKQQRKP